MTPGYDTCEWCHRYYDQCDCDDFDPLEGEPDPRTGLDDLDLDQVG